jgi:hypothetical protein
MPGPGLWMARHRAFTPVKTALRGITAPPLHAGYPAERCARRMQTNHRAGARRNPSPVEVRRVTKLPAHMASKPERSSRSGSLSKAFTGVKCPAGWTSRSSGWLLVPHQGEVSPVRPATSIRHGILMGARWEEGQGFRDPTAAIMGGYH